MKSTDLRVQQGSINGPYLFSILINDVHFHVKEALTLLFADDTTLTVFGPPSDIFMLLEKGRKCMEQVLDWMDSNYMELNLQKTQMILNGLPRIVRAIGPVSVIVRGITITSTNTVKSLGLLDRLCRAICD
jgi:hypothetical protein